MNSWKGTFKVKEEKGRLQSSRLEDADAMVVLVIPISHRPQVWQSQCAIIKTRISYAVPQLLPRCSIPPRKLKPQWYKVLAASVTGTTLIIYAIASASELSASLHPQPIPGNGCRG